jgi:hypothetical protein
LKLFYLLLTQYSLSEYGCNTNTRTFNAVKGLYGDTMTKVYSGGLVYEYTKEDDKDYGLVDISSGKVDPLPDFKALKTAFSGAPDPKGDAGAKTNGTPSKCPAKSDHWNVSMKDDELPAMPAGVSDFFKNGAGSAKGLVGGSQDAGADKVQTAPAASGAVTTGSTAGGSGSGTSSGSSSSPSKASAASSFSVSSVMYGLVVLASSAFML